MSAAPKSVPTPSLPPDSPTEPDHAGAPISDLQQFLLLVGHPLCGILTETVAGGSGVRGALGKGCFLIIVILLLIIIILRTFLVIFINHFFCSSRSSRFLASEHGSPEL